MQHVWRSEEDKGSPGAVVSAHCEPPCRCQELKSGSLLEQQVLLTIESPILPGLFSTYKIKYVTQLVYAVSQ